MRLKGFSFSLIMVLIAMPATVLAQSAYGPGCDAEEVELLRKSRFTDLEILNHCSGGSSFPAGTKFLWKICRVDDSNHCRPSITCVATEAEMQAVIIRNGDEDVWKMTGETAGVCGVQKYHWEICRKADQTCRPSNACVATLKEMEDVIEARGDEHIWRATGKTAGPC